MDNEIAAYRAAGEPVTPQDLNDAAAILPPKSNTAPRLRAAAEMIDVNPGALPRIALPRC